MTFCGVDVGVASVVAKLVSLPALHHTHHQLSSTARASSPNITVLKGHSQIFHLYALRLAFLGPGYQGQLYCASPVRCRASSSVLPSKGQGQISTAQKLLSVGLASRYCL